MLSAFFTFLPGAFLCLLKKINKTWRYDDGPLVAIEESSHSSKLFETFLEGIIMKDCQSAVPASKNNTMKLKKIASTVLAVAAFAGMAASPSVSQAATVNTLFVPGTNQIQDQDAERVLRGESVVTSGVFAVGDVIESILRFDTTNGSAIADTLPAPYQLTGYSQLRIAGIQDLPDAVPGQNLVRLHFGATGNLGAGVLAELYERTSALQPGFSAGAAPATGIANILAQTLIAEFGLNGTDDFWYSDTINDIGVVAGFTRGSGQAAAGVFGLTALNNPGALPIIVNGILSPIDGNLHDVVGDVSIYGREVGVNPDWLVSSNINAAFNAVPEPGALSLLGLSLLGLGTSMRRRKA